MSETVRPQREAGLDAPSGPDLSAAADADRHQMLVAQATRFTGAFLRWMDSNARDGLTFTRMELLGLLRDEGPAMMKDLAKALGVTARNMTAMVDALEEAGLVVRRPHPTDRRATLIELTAPGATEADRALRTGAGRFGRLFDALTLPEQQRFFDSMARLLDAMEPPA